MLEIILWVKRLIALGLFGSIAVAIGLLAAQVLGAPPSTSIPPITVERASDERVASTKKRTKDDKGAKRQTGAAGEGDTVYPAPIRAGDDDDEEEPDDRGDDDGPDDDDDGVDDDGASD